jgi:MFS family permease
LIDAYSLKKVFLVGTVLLGLSSTLYLIAPHWTYLYAGLILYYVGARVICTSCTVTCAGELGNEERATGRGVCRTLSSVLALMTPALSAWLVSRWGGMSVTGLRPLYAVQVGVFALTFVLLVRWFRDPAVARPSQHSRPNLSEVGRIFRQRPEVVRLMLVIALMEVPWSITVPYLPLFAHQVKGADEFVLGGITTMMSVAPLIAAIPLGRLADRYGRKRMLFAIAPVVYLGHFCLILAPNQGVLLVSGLLFGFDSLSTAIVAAMAAEIMPRNQMGRWIGIVSLVRGLASIPAPLAGGLLWDQVGPPYVFVAAVALDALVRLPLLASVRETLHLQIDPE